MLSCVEMSGWRSGLPGGSSQGSDVGARGNQVPPPRADGGVRGGRARSRPRAASRPGGRRRRSAPGSTLRVASTLRPDAASIFFRMESASSSESSNAVVSSTIRRFCSRRDERVELAVDLLELDGAALLDDEQEEVVHELVGVAGDVLEHRRLRARVELRVVEQRCAARARRRLRAAKSPSSWWTTSSLPAARGPPGRGPARTCAARRPWT